MISRFYESVESTERERRADSTIDAELVLGIRIIGVFDVAFQIVDARAADQIRGDSRSRQVIDEVCVCRADGNCVENAKSGNAYRAVVLYAQMVVHAVDSQANWAAERPEHQGHSAVVACGEVLTQVADGYGRAARDAEAEGFVRLCRACRC